MLRGSDGPVTYDSLLRRFLVEERGQDLVEYAILAAIFGVIGFLMFPTLVTRMGTAYSTWGTQVNNIWVPNPPSAP